MTDKKATDPKVYLGSKSGKSRVVMKLANACSR